MKFIIVLTVFAVLVFSAIGQTIPEGLSLNQRAPDFAARDQFGQMVSLKDELKKGAVVILFYRGQWCPYCNKQLMRFEDSLHMIRAKGANLLAITPEAQEGVSKTTEKTKASFQILSDNDLEIMKSYGVSFAVDSITVERYKRVNIDLERVNGSNGANLPVPAVYIINRDGIVIFRYFDPNYRNRVSVREVLSHL